MAMNQPPQMQQMQQPAGAATNPSDIPHMLQFDLQITMIALLKQMQNVMTSQANMFEKMKSIPLIAQSVVGLHNAFHATEQLAFEKTKPDSSAVDAQIAQQDAQHKYALDLMAQHHDEQIKQQQHSLATQQAEHSQKLAEIQAMIAGAKHQQELGHADDLHQSQLEQEAIQKAQLLQQAQQGEEQHQQTMSNTQEAHESALEANQDAGSTE